jgi:hypothetical protein
MRNKIKEKIRRAIERLIAFYIRKHYPASNKGNGSSIAGRAITDAQKEIIINRVLVVWKKYPTLRLGQLLVNVLHPNDDIFNIGR